MDRTDVAQSRVMKLLISYNFWKFLCGSKTDGSSGYSVREVSLLYGIEKVDTRTLECTVRLPTGNSGQ
jgi:hypothetical protein